MPTNKRHNEVTGAAFMTTLSVVRPCLCIIYGRATPQPNNPRKQLLLRSLQQSNTVGVGFIPTLSCEAFALYLVRCW